MRKEVFRSTKVADILESHIVDTTLPFGKNKPVDCPMNVVTQKFWFRSHGSCLFTLHGRNIIITDLISGEQKYFRFFQDILPIIQFDSNSDLAEGWFTTCTGMLFSISFSGPMLFHNLPFVPSSFCVYNGKFYLGKRDGSVCIMQNDKVLGLINKPKSFLSDYLHITMFQKMNQVLSMYANENELLFITKDAKLIEVDINGTIKSRTSLYGKSIESAELQKNGNETIILLRTKGLSILKSLVFDGIEFVSYKKIERPNIIDFCGTFNGVHIISSDGSSYNIERLNNNNWELISSEWTPKDDADFYGMYFKQNCIPHFVHNPKAISLSYLSQFPISICYNDDGIPFVGTSASVYQLRPMTPAESIIFRFKNWSEKKTIEGSAARLFSMISSTEWMKIDELLKRGSDIDSVVQKFAKLHFIPNLDFPHSENEINHQFSEIIEFLSLYEHHSWVNPDISSVFWATAVHQIVQTSYILSVVCLFLIKLILQADPKEKLNRLFDNALNMVKQYLKLSVLVDSEILFDKPVFYSVGFDQNSFIGDIRKQISQLLCVDKVSQTLIKDRKACSFLISYLLYCDLPSVYYGLALCQLGKYKQAIDFYLSKKDVLDFTDEYMNIIDAFSQQGMNEITSKFAEIVIGFNPIRVSPLLFQCYININDYIKAFEIIQSIQSDVFKIDMIRVFIRKVIDRKQVKTLLELKMDSLISFFANELSTYSKDTLPIAAALFHSLKDNTQIVDSLYRFARWSLKENSLEGMRKAETSLLLCLCFLKNDLSAAREFSSNILLTKERVYRLFLRLKCCLATSNPQEIAKQSNMDLLKALSKDSPSLVKEFLESGLLTIEEISNYVIYLINSKKTSLLEEILNNDKREWHYRLHETAIEAYINNKQDPPIWIIDSFRQKAPFQLFNLCYKKGVKEIVFQVLFDMYENHEHLPAYFVPMLRAFGLDETIVKEITQ